MHKAVASILLLLASTAAVGATAWETYLKNPTPANAARVRAIQYSKSGHLSKGDLAVVSHQVDLGREAAIRMLGRLVVTHRLSADTVEVLSQMLGTAARTNAPAFLRAVGPRSNCFGVRPAGDNFVDRDDFRKSEADARASALRVVNAAELVPTRDICLAQLTKVGHGG